MKNKKLDPNWRKHLLAQKHGTGGLNKNLPPQPKNDLDKPTNTTITAKLKNKFGEFEIEFLKIKTDNGEVELTNEDYKELLETMNGKRGKVTISKDGEYVPEEVYVYNKDSEGKITKATFHTIKD
jgi:hypothetical protein